VSATTISEELGEIAARRGRRIDAPLEQLFRAFDTSLLLTAKRSAQGAIFERFVEAAIAAANRRREKFSGQSDALLLSDFIGAFQTVQQTASQEAFAVDGIDALRRSCPYC